MVAGGEDGAHMLTADCIAYHAALHPDDVAIIDNKRNVTYATFHRDIGKFVRAVREFDLKPGDRVAIQ